MRQLPFTPSLNNFSIGIADDVISIQFSNLPMSQRLYSHLPYTANVSFILFGDDHDELMQFWRDNETAYFTCALTLEDSHLRDYRCLFGSAPQIKVLGGTHESWSNEQIIDGEENGIAQDTSNRVYQTDFSLIAYVHHRTSQDEKILEDYLLISKDEFVGYEVEG